MNTKLIVVSITMLAFLASPAFAKKKKHKHLPPGLQKKLDRGQSLPPGWQKKIARGEVLDINTYRQAEIIIPIDRHGVVSILVEGRVVRLIEATRVILDVFNYR